MSQCVQNDTHRSPWKKFVSSVNSSNTEYTEVRKKYERKILPTNSTCTQNK